MKHIITTDNFLYKQQNVIFSFYVLKSTYGQDKITQFNALVQFYYNSKLLLAYLADKPTQIKENKLETTYFDILPKIEDHLYGLLQLTNTWLNGERIKKCEVVYHSSHLLRYCKYLSGVLGFDHQDIINAGQILSVNEVDKDIELQTLFKKKVLEIIQVGDLNKRITEVINAPRPKKLKYKPILTSDNPIKKKEKPIKTINYLLEFRKMVNTLIEERQK